MFAQPFTPVLIPDGDLGPITVSGISEAVSISAVLSSQQPFFQNWASIIKNGLNVGASTTVEVVVAVVV